MVNPKPYLEVAFPDRTRNGQLRPTLPNTKLAIQQLGVECRYDLFKLQYIVAGHEIKDHVGDAAEIERQVVAEPFGLFRQDSDRR